MNKRGRLFVVSAPSGAGKTTLCEKLIATLPHVVRSISMTTRRMRQGEVEGRDYFFVSKEEFARKIDRKEFLEYARVFGNYYGTPLSFVKKNLERNIDVLLNIDVQGAMQIRKNFRRDSVLIFVLPPSLEDLKKRLIQRKTDALAQIKKRLEVAKKEISYLKYYDYQVVNDDLKKAFQELASIVIAVRCRVQK